MASSQSRAPAALGGAAGQSGVARRTSDALINATTSLPSRRPSSRTASTVIDATTRWPPTSSATLAIAAPSSMEVTVPGSWLRALIFIVRRLVERHDADRFGREGRPGGCAGPQAQPLDLL